MKIAILGDPHIGGGYAMGKVDPINQINSRLTDFLNTFDYVINYLVNNRIVHFIITGDVFDSKRPQAAELNLFAEKIAILSDLKIHTHILVGNHDLIYSQKTSTIELLNALKLPYVTVYSDIKTVECVGDCNANITFLPFRNKKMLKCTTNEESIKRITDILNHELASNENGNHNILIGHLMVEGTLLSNVVEGEYHGEIVMPFGSFNGFDAVIMGHVHTHTIIKKKPFISYVGSMERKKMDDGKDKKYLLCINCEKELSFVFEELPVREVYDMYIYAEEDAMTYVYKYLECFSKTNVLENSIVRLQVHLDSKMIKNVNIDEIKSVLYNKYKVNNCVNVNIHIASERQLRKESITEKSMPLESFYAYLDLEEDTPLSGRVKELGTMIINEVGANYDTK